MRFALAIIMALCVASCGNGLGAKHPKWTKTQQDQYIKTGRSP